VNREIEQDRCDKATVLVNTWLDVFATQSVETVLSRAIEKAVLQNKSSETVWNQSLTNITMLEILRTLLYRVVDAAIREHPILSELYPEKNHSLPDNSSAEIPELDDCCDGKVYFQFDDLTQGRVDQHSLNEWFNETRIKEILIHKYFLETAVKTPEEVENADYEAVQDHIKASSVLLMTQHKYQMREIYIDVLKDAAETFVIGKQYLHDAFQELMHELTMTIATDKGLNHKWMEINLMREEEFRRVCWQSAECAYSLSFFYILDALATHYMLVWYGWMYEYEPL